MERIHSRTAIPHAESRARLEAPGWLEGLQQRLADRSPALMIDGAWEPAAAGGTVDSMDPSTGQRLLTAAVASPEDVDRAVRTAAAAQPGWAALPLARRIDHIEHLRDLIAERGAEFAAVDALDAGLPVSRMFNDIDNILRAVRGWVGLASAYRGEVVEGVPGLHFTRSQPYGVVARIVAFNHPILFAVKGTLAALLAGNSVVLKPADQTPASALLLGDLVARALPPGVFNVVTGNATTGEALVTHPAVRRIAFTGSDRVGRLIQASAARDRVRNVTLELGGKNPMLILPDADVGAVADNVVFGMNLRANQGQSCGSTSRLLVHEDLVADLENAVAERFAQLRIGPAIDPDVDMGPMIDIAAADRVRRYIAAGLEDGARLVTGGLDDPRVDRDGPFVAPTLFSEVPDDARIACEEIFGPVVACSPWTEFDEAIERANSVPYGLTASVWTQDLNVALEAADRLETGYVWINESASHYFGTPFGGWKDSGVGREESMEEYESFLQRKSVHIKQHR